MGGGSASLGVVVGRMWKDEALGIMVFHEIMELWEVMTPHGVIMLSCILAFWQDILAGRVFLAENQVVLVPDKVDVQSRKVVMFGSWICQPVHRLVWTLS